VVSEGEITSLTPPPPAGKQEEGVAPPLLKATTTPTESQGEDAPMEEEWDSGEDEPEVMEGVELTEAELIELDNPDTPADRRTLLLERPKKRAQSVLASGQKKTSKATIGKRTKAVGRPPRVQASGLRNTSKK